MGGGIAEASPSSSNKDDRKQLKLMVEDLFGKVFREHSYISRKLLQQLLEQWIFMVAKVRQNMINKLISMLNKVIA